MVSDSRVIVALDYPEAGPALALAGRLDPARVRVKVGKELFTAAGPRVVEDLSSLGFEVFLDLKYHDIPNTVAGACRAAAELGVWMVNVHALGGRRMLEAAREAVAASRRPPRLIAVTVLTSLDAGDLQALGFSEGPEALVLRLAKLTADCGLDGVVCSPGRSRPCAWRCPRRLRSSPRGSGRGAGRPVIRSGCWERAKRWPWVRATS